MNQPTTKLNLRRIPVGCLLFIFWVLTSIPIKAQPPSLIWGFGMGGAGNLSYMVNAVNDLDKGLHGQVIAGGIIGGNIDLDPSADTFSVVSGTPTLFNGFVGRYSAQGTLLSGYAFNSSSQVIITSVACDSLGRIYVAGTYTDNMDINPGPGTFPLTTAAGDRNMFLASMDSSGQINYALNLGGVSSNDQLLDMKCDDSGNVYITGSIDGVSDLDPGTSQGNYTGSAGGNMFMAKYAPDGQYVWGMMVPGNPFGHVGHSLSIAPGGNVFVALRFRGLIDIDPSANVVAVDDLGAGDILVAEFTPSGNYVQFWQIGGPGGVVLDKISVACDQLGRVYVSAKFDGILDVDPGPGLSTYNSALVGKCFVGAYNSTGQLIWSAFPGFMPSGSQGLDVDDQGGVYLHLSEMVDEARVVKYDLNGTLEYQLDFTGNAYGFAIKASGVDEFYTGGAGGNALVNGNAIGGSGSGYRALLCRFSSCQPPVILAQSSSVNACEDDQVILNVTASGSGIAYQWYKNNVLLAGATASDLELNSINFSDAGTYHCVVSGDCGNQSTAQIVIHVNANPVASIVPNGTFLDAYPVFPPIFYYEWLLNGQSTGITLPFMPNPGPGAHQVVVINSDGCSDTSAAFIITGEEAQAGDLLRLYPNPASEVIMVDGINAGSTRYTISGADGKIVIVGNYENNNGMFKIDTSELVPGYYQIEFAIRNEPLIRIHFLKSR